MGSEMCIRDRHEGANQEDGCWCTAMGSVQPPSMQCAAYNRLGTGVHGLSHVVVGHIGLVVHNNAQHDMQGLTAWLPVCVCVNHMARLSGHMSNCPTMICLREQLNRVCKIAHLAATASQKKKSESKFDLSSGLWVLHATQVVPHCCHFSLTRLCEPKFQHQIQSHMDFIHCLTKNHDNTRSGYLIYD